MDIQRIVGYYDPRFPQEVLNQHGAFLADGVPWSFRITSEKGAAVSSAQPFDGEALAEMADGILPFVAEARRRGIFHVRDMALYSHEEQEEKWDGWCDAYFAARGGG